MITLLFLACTRPTATVDTEPVQGFDSGTPDTAHNTDTDTDSGSADTDTDTDRDTATDTGRDTAADTGAPPADTADTGTAAIPECWNGTWVDDFGNPIDAGVGLVGASTASTDGWMSADMWMDESTHTGTATLATCGTAFRFYCSSGTVEMTANPGTSDFGGTVTFTSTQVRSTSYGMGDTDHCQFYATGLINGVEAAAVDEITVRF